MLEECSRSVSIFTLLTKCQQGTACAEVHTRLLLCPKGVAIMAKLVRIVVQLPVELKEQLDALKQQGYTTSGFIRATLERELNKVHPRPEPIVRKVVNK
jgi:hypothetical protein